MEGIKYPERIERMLDVMIAIPKDAWGLVFLELEKKIGAAALEGIILEAYQIEKAMGLSKSKGVTKGERGKQSRGDQFAV